MLSLLHAGHEDVRRSARDARQPGGGRGATAARAGRGRRHHPCRRRGGRGAGADHLPAVRGQGRAARRRCRARASPTYVAGKTVAADSGDPIEDLRGAWDTHIGFGLANAALFGLLADPSRGGRSPAAAAGLEVLRNRVRRVAATGRLRVTERRAVDLIHAAGTGAVLTLLSMAPQDRRPRPGGRHVRRGDAGDPDRRPARSTSRARPRPPSRSAPSCPTSRPSATPNARCYPSGWTEPAAADDPGSAAQRSAVASPAGVSKFAMSIRVSQSSY